MRPGGATVRPAARGNAVPTQRLQPEPGSRGFRRRRLNLQSTTWRRPWGHCRKVCRSLLQALPQLLVQLLQCLQLRLACQPHSPRRPPRTAQCRLQQAEWVALVTGGIFGLNGRCGEDEVLHSAQFRDDGLRLALGDGELRPERREAPLLRVALALQRLQPRGNGLCSLALPLRGGRHGRLLRLAPPLLLTLLRIELRPQLLDLATHGPLPAEASVELLAEQRVLAL
mmetsp:Transcript_28407/g.81666  ORF Transcript_28407/g.81666 Transcript_28407/m.81666 type:complete len:227 (-) Transcript_28407:218-898(-)